MGDTDKVKCSYVDMLHHESILVGIGGLGVKYQLWNQTKLSSIYYSEGRSEIQSEILGKYKAHM